MADYVLIVDDDMSVRQVLSDMIAILGRKVQTARDGEEALEKIQMSHPVLVLLDIMMPKLDGFGVLARLRANPGTRHIPVIVITGVGSDQIDMLRLPGVMDVIQKGAFSISGLKVLIDKALGEAAPPHAGAAGPPQSA